MPEKKQRRKKKFNRALHSAKTTASLKNLT
jgi:hypothetical protein